VGRFDPRRRWSRTRRTFTSFNYVSWRPTHRGWSCRAGHELSSKGNPSDPPTVCSRPEHNEADMPALPDTGSPPTVMNACCQHCREWSKPDPAAHQNNPLAALQSVQTGTRPPPVYILTIFAGGIRANLRKSTGDDKTTLRNGLNGKKVQFTGSCLRGDLPPGSLEWPRRRVESPPAVVLVGRCSDDDPALLRATENVAGSMNKLLIR
jgi:hypothetical protein